MATTTKSPTGSPTKSPSTSPTVSPTTDVLPTSMILPTNSPTASPSASPTGSPTKSPTTSPTPNPIATVSPTTSISSTTATPTASVALQQTCVTCWLVPALTGAGVIAIVFVFLYTPKCQFDYGAMVYSYVTRYEGGFYYRTSYEGGTFSITEPVQSLEVYENAVRANPVYYAQQDGFIYINICNHTLRRYLYLVSKPGSYVPISRQFPPFHSGLFIASTAERKSAWLYLVDNRNRVIARIFTRRATPLYINPPIYLSPGTSIAIIN